MRLEKTVHVLETYTNIEYEITMAYDNSFAILSKQFHDIAEENDILVDEIHFTAYATSGYSGDQNIVLEIDITRPSTSEEHQTFLNKQNTEKEYQKGKALQEIARLQKVVEILDKETEIKNA